MRRLYPSCRQMDRAVNFSHMAGFSAELDLLSPWARDALKLGASGAYTALVVRGSGHAQAAGILEKMRRENVLSQPIANTDDAAALLAALWLWHDWLEQSHKIAQTLQTGSGSFWHAIMHRREGDFSNSK